MTSQFILQIKQDILDIKSRLTIIETKLQEMGAITTPEGTEGLGGETIGEGKVPRGTGVQDLVQATYTIRTASTAMRGYLMLLKQANLSTDQKQMIRELEYGMMMMLKAAWTIKLLILAYRELEAAALGPIGLLYTAFAFGGLASTLAFGNKMMGGTV